MAGPHTEFPSTDFAITSVNVPDRLDQREVDDRKQQDDASFYARRRPLRTWSRRLLPYLVLLALVALAGRWFSDERESFGASRMAQRMSAVLHMPVSVKDSRIRTTPSPAVVLSGVDLGGQVKLDEIVLEFTAPSLWKAVISGQRRWGDVVISPTTLTFEQAGRLLTWVALLDRLVPDSVTRVRIAQVRFPGSGLLPDRYEAISRRESNGLFASVMLRRLDLPGSMQLQVTPDRAGAPVAFQCDAADWRPPFAPNTPWSEVVANGHVSADAIELEKFTLGSAWGAVEGHLSVRRQDHAALAWTASGQLATVGIDIPTVILQVTHSAPTELTPPMSGTAALDAVVAGAGVTPEDALGRLVVSGEIRVRNAELSGINLGYAASRPAAHAAGSGASTRFTKFDATFVAGNGGVAFRDLRGVAGALKTHGELTVAPNLDLNGLLHVDLGTTRVQAPLRIRVRGTIAHPEFGR